MTVHTSTAMCAVNMLKYFRVHKQLLSQPNSTPCQLLWPPPRTSGEKPSTDGGIIYHPDIRQGCA